MSISSSKRPRSNEGRSSPSQRGRPHVSSSPSPSPAPPDPPPATTDPDASPADRLDGPPIVPSAAPARPPPTDDGDGDENDDRRRTMDRDLMSSAHIPLRTRPMLLPTLLSLDPSLAFHILDCLSPRSLARLSQTCWVFRTLVNRYRAFQGAQWEAFSIEHAPKTPQPSQGEDDGHSVPTVSASTQHSPVSSPPFEPLPDNFPPSFSHQATVQLGNKLYLPYLSANPSVYVLDINTHQWTRKYLTITPRVSDSEGMSSLETQQTEPTWVPLMAPSAGWGEDRIYLFGGTHHPLVAPLDLPIAARDPHGLGDPLASATSADEVSERGGTTTVGAERSSASTSSQQHMEDLSFEDRDSFDERSVRTGELSDALYEINLDGWELRELGSAANPHITLLSGKETDSTPLGHTPSSGSTPSMGTGCAGFRSAMETEGSSPDTDEIIWPTARKGHSFNTLDQKLVLFGGLTENSVGDNDVFLYDPRTRLWSRPKVNGMPPELRFGHASCVSKNDLFIFGGAQIDNPVNIIWDDLHRLTYTPSKDAWSWHTYRSPDAYGQRRAQRRAQRAAAHQSVTQASPAASAPHGFEAGPSHRRSSGSSSSSEEMHSSNDIPTTGLQPRERLEATIVPVGDHKLAIFAGLAIVPGTYDSEAYDEYCAYNISAIDVFDTRHRHWSHLGVSGSGDAKNSFVVESCCAYVAPPSPECVTPDNDHWQFIVVGHRLNWEEFQVSIVQSGLLTGESSSSESGSGQVMQVDEEQQQRQDRHHEEQQPPPSDLGQLYLHRDVPGTGIPISLDPSSGLNHSQLGLHAQQPHQSQHHHDSIADATPTAGPSAGSSNGGGGFMLSYGRPSSSDPTVAEVLPITGQALSQVLAQRSVPIHGPVSHADAPSVPDPDTVPVPANRGPRTPPEAGLAGVLYGSVGSNVIAAAVGTVENEAPSERLPTEGTKGQGERNGAWITFYSRNGAILLASTTFRRVREDIKSKLASTWLDGDSDGSSSHMDIDSQLRAAHKGDDPDELASSFGTSDLRPTGANGEPSLGGSPALRNIVGFVETAGFVKSLLFER